MPLSLSGIDRGNHRHSSLSVVRIEGQETRLSSAREASVRDPDVRRVSEMLAIRTVQGPTRHPQAPPVMAPSALFVRFLTPLALLVVFSCLIVAAKSKEDVVVTVSWFAGSRRVFGMLILVQHPNASTFCADDTITTGSGHRAMRRCAESECLEGRYRVCRIPGHAEGIRGALPL